MLYMHPKRMELTITKLYDVSVKTKPPRTRFSALLGPGVSSSPTALRRVSLGCKRFILLVHQRICRVCSKVYRSVRSHAPVSPGDRLSGLCLGAHPDDIEI